MLKVMMTLSTLFFVGVLQATEVAVLDFRAALLNSEIGIEAAKEPKQKVAAMDARLKEEENAVNGMIQDLKRDELTLSPEEVQKRRQAIAERDKNVRAMAAKMQNEARTLEQKLIQDLTPKGEAALKALIEEQGIELVLNRQASLYAGAKVDITSELVQRINKEN